MTKEKYSWHKIAVSAAEIDFSTNGITTVDVNGKKVCLAMHNGTINACAHKCPHAGGIMADGFIDATGNVVCPLYRYKFSLDKGRNVTGEGYYLKTYKVEEREDGLYIELEEKNFLSFL